MDYDLSKRPPRRWSDSVDGIVWLPRFIDKAHAYDAGTLGIYVFGQSPTDASFLQTAGVGYAQFLECVRSAADDAGVLSNIEGAAPGATARLRTWSANPPAIVRLTYGIVDGDEGYAKGFPSIVRLIPKPVFAGLIRLWRRVAPLRLRDVG
jgi:Domain of unknown function (DUF5069)